MAFDPAHLVRDYGDVEGEARAARAECALFDFSFMARARLDGPGARRALARFQPRPLDDLAPGRIHYAFRLNDAGHVEADLTLWNLGEDVFEIMSGRRRDIADLSALVPADAKFRDLSEETAIHAVQGPRALALLAAFADADAIARIPYFGAATARVAGVECLVGRLGFTGERGFELITPRSQGHTLWGELAKRARPAGFAAADILRIEAGFMLFANECRLPVNPAELGLAAFAGPRGGGARVRLVCFEATCPERPVLWRPPPATQLPRRSGEIAVTSACHSIVADRVLGLGFVLADDARPGCAVRDPLGSFRDVRIVPMPFHDRDKKRPRGSWSPGDFRSIP